MFLLLLLVLLVFFIFKPRRAFSVLFAVSPGRVRLPRQGAGVRRAAHLPPPVVDCSPVVCGAFRPDSVEFVSGFCGARGVEKWTRAPTLHTPLGIVDNSLTSNPQSHTADCYGCRLRRFATAPVVISGRDTP